MMGYRTSVLPDQEQEVVYWVQDTAWKLLAAVNGDDDDVCGGDDVGMLEYGDDEDLETVDGGDE